MEWQDISSAPKDGTEVLVWDDIVYVAAWVVKYRAVGWYPVFEDDETRPPLDPSHWMPLPDGPADSG